VDLQDLVLYELPVLSLKDSGTKALALMNDFQIHQLPIIERDDYLALVQEDDLLDWDTPEESLAKAKFLKFRPAVFENMHPFDAIKVIKEFNLSILPLLDTDQNFIGCITRNNLFQFLTDTNTFKQEGGIIILTVSPIEYSLAEIARLAESDNILLQGVLVRQIADENMLQVTIKTNKHDLRSFVATLRRYEYQIEATYNALLDDQSLKDNYDMLMRFFDL
jgi:predicted transcriptional regulator